jgi:2,4-dienoyl-CoA reductase-like NADH-dependent reductase (Old Yellow Enzyme family)
MYEFSQPRSLDIEEIASIVNDYRVAAKNAMEAGTNKFGFPFIYLFQYI